MSGASPKDGPSAGISICTSLLSLILNKPVPADLAMTGELSLNGEVCKIGKFLIIKKNIYIKLFFWLILGGV
jgi:ATP-dependent Lon protease